MSALAEQSTPSIARSVDFRVEKGWSWHAIDFTRNFILPTIGLSWIAVEVAKHTATIFDLGLLISFLVLTGIGMSVGLHRLFTHQAFEAHTSVRYALAFLGTMAWQRPLFAWVARHRLHHKLADEEGDYHSPHVLFDGTPISSRWRKASHAHYFWLHVADPSPATIEATVPDLSADSGLVWINKNYDVICLISVLIPGLIAGAFYQTWAGFLSGVMWGGLARIAILLHLTWIVNSACHMMGKATYVTKDESHNIGFLGWLVFGEGYHNNHHAFPYSPRIGFDKWQVDIGWYAIRVLEALGLVSKLKPIPDKDTRMRRLRDDREKAVAAAQRALPFLTLDDLALLLDAGEIVDVARGTVVIQEGDRERDLMVIVGGSARVLRGLHNAIAFATMSGGEIVGEIAFLDREAASATVVADRSLRILRLEEGKLDSLLHAVPGLAGRLYQSLAHGLAARLRARTELIPPFAIEDVPQVRRFHATRATASAEAPAAFVEVVEEFKRTMLHAQRELKDRRHDVEAVKTKVMSACEGASKVLDDYVRSSSSPETLGAYAFRESFPFMMSSALLERFYMKPRGYAGDFETIEAIYAGTPGGASAIGRMIDEWARTAGASQAVRHRRAKLVHEITARLPLAPDAEPINVTSLAVGPGREIFDILAAQPSAPVRFIGIDIDDAALGFCAGQRQAMGVSEGKLTLFQDNLVKLSLGRGRVSIPQQDFIYSMGLIDYLDAKLVVRLVDWAFDQLGPGGTLVLGNFATGNRYKAFMDHIVDWVLIHRTADEMRELFARSKFGKTDVRIDADPTGIQLFAYCTKT